MVSRRTLYAIVAIVLVGVVVVASVGYYYLTKPSGEQPTIEKTELVIGGTLSLSAGWAWAAEDERDAVNAIVEFINNEFGGVYVKELNRTLRLRAIIYDDMGDVSKTPALYEKLLTIDKVDFVWACYPNEYYLQQLSAKEKIPMVMFAGTPSETISKQYFFRVGAAYERSGAAYVDFIDGAVNKNPAIPTEQKVRKVAILRSTYEYGYRMYKGIKDEIEKVGGMTIVADETFEEPTPATLTPQLSRIKAAEPDALICLVAFSESITMVVRTLKELDFYPKLLMDTWMITQSAFLQAVGADANYIVGSVAIKPVDWQVNWMGKTFSAVQLQQYFKTKLGEEFSVYHTLTFSAITALTQAIYNAGTLDKEKVRDELELLKMTMMGGPFQMDATDHTNAIVLPIAVQIQNGQAVAVWPKTITWEGKTYDYADHELMYPAPSWSGR